MKLKDNIAIPCIILVQLFVFLRRFMVSAELKVLQLLFHSFLWDAFYYESRMWGFIQIVVQDLIMKHLTAVIDSHSRDVLIAMAHKEGLLNASKETDGVLEEIFEKSKSPNYRYYRMNQQILEQLVLTPTLAVHSMQEWLWEALEGSLKDEGRIINLGNEEPDFSADIESLSSDIIAGLVQAGGDNIHPSQFKPLAIAASDALKEQEEYVKTSGKEVPNMIAKAMIDSAFSAFGWHDENGKYGKYSEEEYEAQRQRNKHYGAFKPIDEAIKECRILAQLAEKHDMLIKTPQFSDAEQTQVFNPNFVPGTESDELVLFRIVAHQLGKTSFRPTIKESLKLAFDPATIAFREQLELWLSALLEGNETDLKFIQKEISQAQRAISRLSRVKQIGMITTIVGVPVTVVETIIPFLYGLGIVNGVVGKISLARDIAVSRKYKWVMFGNTK